MNTAQNINSDVEILLRDRMRKLEGTLAAYDSVLNTAALDGLRKRNAELERALLAMLAAPNLNPAQQGALTLLLEKNFHPKY